MLRVPLPRRGGLRCRERSLTYGDRTAVVGIINLTPDSFSGDGLAGQIDRAVERAVRMVAEGAALLDVGGESTRPAAVPIGADEEIRRVVPAIAAIVAAVDAPVSIDTRRADVAEAALRAGAHLLNDVTGLQRDPRLARLAAEFGAPLIVVHSPGESWSVQWPATYGDVVADVRNGLARSIDVAVAAGVPLDQIIVDPGFGFGKGARDNLEIVRRLGDLRTLGRPVLLGASRKQTIGRVLGVPVEERREGSLALAALAVAEGVDFVRVHDVRETVQVVRMADAVVRGVGSIPE
jgi:dihydropteroate synthase